jgi:septal ring factor EnvC (AmiA/AmiB activator)
MPLENPNERGVYAEALLEESGSMSLDHLKVLEGRIDDVLARHSAVCAERDQLQEQLKQAQARITELSGQLASFEKERAQVRARVESILGRLEGLDLS